MLYDSLLSRASSFGINELVLSSLLEDIRQAEAGTLFTVSQTHAQTNASLSSLASFFSLLERERILDRHFTIFCTHPDFSHPYPRSFSLMSEALEHHGTPCPQCSSPLNGKQGKMGYVKPAKTRS